MTIQALITLVCQNLRDNFTCAEVGVWTGETLIAYAPVVQHRNGKIYAIDNFCGNPTATDVHSYKPENADKVCGVFLDNISGFKDTVILLRGNSHEMLEQIPDKSLDLCFIDCDHRYSSVKKDIEISLRKIKPDGILCGHDCERLDLGGTFTDNQLELDFLLDLQVHPGICQAVHELLNNNVEIIPSEGVAPIWVWKGNR
jgi:hypothetical protein